MEKLPVAALQVGCVTVPSIGCMGVAGCGLTVTPTEAVDAQLPSVAVTV